MTYLLDLKRWSIREEGVATDPDRKAYCYGVLIGFMHGQGHYSDADVKRMATAKPEAFLQGACDCQALVSKVFDLGDAPLDNDFERLLTEHYSAPLRQR